MRSGNPRFQPSTRFEPRTAYRSTDLAHERRRNRALCCTAEEPTVDWKLGYSVKALHHSRLSESVQMCLLGLKREFLSIKADERV
jgi:hypothetical protein